MKKQVYGSLSVIALATLFPLTVGAQEAVSFSSNGYIQIEKNLGEEVEEPVNPIDPTEPLRPGPGEDGEENPHAPGTKGPLSINYVSNVQFGKQTASGNDAVYSVKPDRLLNSANQIVEVPNYVQVTDNRGTNAGWQLSVKQNGNFKNGEHELTGTELVFSNPVLSSVSGKGETSPAANARFTVTPEGSSVSVVQAAVNEGMGTWAIRFGEDNEEAKESIQLNIPGDSKKVAGFYKTSLTWILSDTPMNE